MKSLTFNPLRLFIPITFFAALAFMASCSGGAEKAGPSTVLKTKMAPPQIDINTAVVTGNINAVKQHIIAGSNLNEKDPFGGSSPLISATVFGKAEIAKLLIDAGADINFQNNDGSTPLHTAAFFCRPQIVQMLLDKGASKTIKNKFGGTAYDNVAGPFDQAKNGYDMMGKLLGPMGLKLDYAYITKTRPQIASMLK